MFWQYTCKITLRLVRVWEIELESQPIIQARLDIRVDASPNIILNDRPILGPTSRGLVHVNDNNPNKVLQLHLWGSTDFRGRCPRATGLGKI